MNEKFIANKMFSVEKKQNPAHNICCGIRFVVVAAVILLAHLYITH